MPEVKLFAIGEARESLIQDKPYRLTIDGRVFCLIRTATDFVITDGLCPHMRAELWNGPYNPLSQVLICPWHRFGFSIRTGTEGQQRCDPLRTYKVIEKDGDVWVEV